MVIILTQTVTPTPTPVVTPTPTPTSTGLPTPGAFECPAGTLVDVTLSASVTLAGHALAQGTVICLSANNPLMATAIPPGLAPISFTLTTVRPNNTGDCSAFPGTTFAALTSVATGIIAGASGVCLGHVT